MTPEQLRASVLQQAMEGKLVKQKYKEKIDQSMPFKRSDLIPYKIPENWNWVILGSVASFLNGRAYKKSELLDDNKLTPVLRVGNLFTNSKWYYSDLKLDSNKYIDKGDLIYAWSASFGPRIWQGGHVIYHYHIWKVNFNKSLVDKKFLEYFLSDERNVLGETKVHGSTMKHITKTNMEHLPFPLPPLTEQKRIVTKLEKLMPLVDEYEKAYNRLKSIDDGFNDKMKQSILQYAMEGKLVKQNSNDEPASELLKKIKDEKKQLVKEKKIKRSKSLPKIAENEKLFDIPENWEWVRLKDITNFGNFNSVAGQDIQEGSWVLNMEDIIKNGGGFNKFTIKNLNDDFKSNKYIVEVGDVLYGKLRPYLRKIEIAPKNGFTTTEMFPIKVINQNLISPYYLRYVMLSPYFANRINGSTYGMKMPRVGTKYLASMLIPLPPFEEQKRIVTKVEKMMALVR
jgi:type I restriction enzyme S subunit